MNAQEQFVVITGDLSWWEQGITLLDVNPWVWIIPAAVLAGTSATQAIKITLRDSQGQKKLRTYQIRLVSMGLVGGVAFWLFEEFQGLDFGKALAAGVAVGLVSPYLWDRGESVIRRYFPWFLPVLGEDTRKNLRTDRVWTDAERRAHAKKEEAGVHDEEKTIIQNK